MVHWKAAPILPRCNHYFCYKIRVFFWEMARLVGAFLGNINFPMCIRSYNSRFLELIWVYSSHNHAIYIIVFACNFRKLIILSRLIIVFVFTALRLKIHLQCLCWMWAACPPHASFWIHHSSAHLDQAVVRTSDISTYGSMREYGR